MISVRLRLGTFALVPLVVLVVLALVAVRPARAQQGASPRSGPPRPQSLKKLTLEELAGIEVTSAGRKEERASRAAAAIYVITNDEIRRSGARSVPEALRLATGLHVARFNNGSWAISARGFNITTANKLQVLIDGRTVYTPLFSGVFWDVQDVLLEDIDRIEVIRGPGATLWGANAVNGVINIVTRRARDTQGALAVAGGGTEERFGALRFGGSAGQRLFYRVYTKYTGRDELATATGEGGGDEVDRGQAGFRADWEASSRDSFTLQGDFNRGRMGLFQRDDIATRGGNVLGRWTRTFSDDSELQVQMYVDRTSRFVPRQFDEVRTTFDADLQHRFRAAGGRSEMVWGLGVRASGDKTQPSPILFFEPRRQTLALYSLFAQNEFSLVPDRLFLTLGSKFEHNTYTGWEVQPTVRIGWTPRENEILWGAVSRAVRTPTRFDTDLRITQGALLLIRGSRQFESEELVAYEAGYRTPLHPRVSLDVATWYNDYDNLRSQEPPANAPIPLTLRNLMRGRTYGAELGAVFQPASWWRLHGGYTNLQVKLRPGTGSRDSTRGSQEANDPRTIVSFRSFMDLPRGVELDFWARHVSRLPSGNVPSYAVFDVRLGWRPTPKLELSINGQNLPDRRHREFGPAGRPVELERGVYGRAAWQF